MDHAIERLTPIELDGIVEALGRPGRVGYAPPNIYPMSAPRFTEAAGARRFPPAGDEVGIYVHIPFCNYSCSFCFYSTRTSAPEAEQSDYVAALSTELEALEAGVRLTQLYVGGGTPTVLPPRLLERTLAGVFRRTRPGSCINTVEGSPESITRDHVDVLLQHGIQRVSMGVQSLSGNVLDTVKRRHGEAQVLGACEMLLEAGLMVNVDLIYGLPGQTHADFSRDFQRLAVAGVHSVTAYNLRVNERTPVGRSLSEDEILDLPRLMHWRAEIKRQATELGFEQTRWHTFRRVRPSTAAETVERFSDRTGEGEQFSVGVSARSRLRNTVYRNFTKYGDYVGAIARGESPVQEVFRMSPEEQRLRHVALSLGDGKPLRRAAYLAEFDRSFDVDFAEPLRRLASVDMISDDGFEITMTERGQLLYDLVTRAFYPRPVRSWLDERQQLASTAANLSGLRT